MFYNKFLQFQINSDLFSSAPRRPHIATIRVISRQMGAIWSSPPAQTNLPPQVVSTSRKRTYRECASMDATPDGEKHRYMVRADSIFWCTRRDIEKQLSKLDLPPYSGVHKIPKWNHFYVTFANQACAAKGVQILQEVKGKAALWTVERLTEPSKKRRRFEQGARGDNNEPRKTAAEVTAKWRDVPYDDQVERKRHKWEKALRLVTKNLKRELAGRGGIEWVKEKGKMDKNKGKLKVDPCCDLIRIVKADEERARIFYRNKNELTVGYSPDQSTPGGEQRKRQVAVGYNLGLMRDAQLAVGQVDEDCLTTSVTAREVARVLKDVIVKSGFEPYDKKTHEGYWRQITIREGARTGDTIVTVFVSPKGLDQGGEQAAKKCKDAVVAGLCDFFDQRPFGLFWQESDHFSAVYGEVQAHHLYGSRAVHERLCGLKFRIQPTAFFQVNTIMAERLYRSIADMAKITNETVILDLCCGTGTIGLSLASRAHSVIGIELSEAAVADAQFNAKLNGITNAKFIAGKVEKCIYNAIKEIDRNRDVVVILDPPRAGVPMNVISAIRAMQGVRRLVYVACAPENIWKNALGLCRPASKAFKLEPFVPIEAIGVDLFPHTDHGELVVLFER